MIVAIAGATGLTGHFCLEKLLNEKSVTKVVSIGRRSVEIKNPKLEEVMLKNGRLTGPVQADAFICCLGTTIKKAGSKEAFQAVDFELPVYLARELKNTGCESFAVISAIGADLSSSIFYNRTKGKMEKGIKELGFKSLSILRPSIIAGPRKESRPAEKVAVFLMKLINPLMVGSLGNYSSIQAEDIAKALIYLVLAHKPGEAVYFGKDIKRVAGG